MAVELPSLFSLRFADKPLAMGLNGSDKLTPFGEKAQRLAFLNAQANNRGAYAMNENERIAFKDEIVLLCQELNVPEDPGIREQTIIDFGIRLEKLGFSLHRIDVPRVNNIEKDFSWPLPRE